MLQSPPRSVEHIHDISVRPSLKRFTNLVVGISTQQQMPCDTQAGWQAGSTHLSGIEGCCKRDCKADSKYDGDDGEAPQETIPLARQPTLQIH